MNKQLQKKLLSYSALATALLAVEKPADAQIVYTPINPPDTIYCNNGITYFLDLNNDRVSDFEFGTSSFFTSTDNHGNNSTLRRSVAVRGLGSNKVGHDIAEKNGDSICNNNWKYVTQLAYYELARHSFFSNDVTNRSAIGNFVGDTAKYLPLELIIDTNTYYGWVRLRIDSFVSMLIVSGYAYDSIASECIVAGDTGTAISTSIPPVAITDEVSIWSYDKKVHIILDAYNLAGSHVIIYNTYGQEVYSSQLNDLQTDIDLTNLPPALYIVTIKNKQSSIKKKIILD